MKALLLGACAGVLSACSAMPQQRIVTEGYIQAQQAKRDAVTACAASADVSGCMLGVALAFGGGGSSDQQPVVKSGWEIAANSPVLAALGTAGLGFLRDVKIAESQERTAIAIAGARERSERAMFGAFDSIANGGFGALERTAQTGFDNAGVGFLALERLGSAAVDASASVGMAIAAMPPTYQAAGDIVGGDYVRDQSTTGRDRVQGDGNETARNVDCVSTGGPGGSVAGSAASTSTGTTIPTSSAYNALTSGLGGGAVNNCGG